MTDKERLEEIKSRVWKDKATYADGDNKSREGHTYTLSDYDYEWLIKQVERVEELEEIKSKLIQRWNDEARLNNDLMEQNQRYREALEFYADQTIYKEELINEASYDADGVCISNDEYAPPVVYLDGGEKARQALEGDEN